MSDWMKRYLTPLVGGTITEVGVGPQGRNGFPFLKVKLPDNTVVKLEVSRDEEGNGPGFLFGLPVPA